MSKLFEAVDKLDTFVVEEEKAELKQLKKDLANDEEKLDNGDLKGQEKTELRNDIADEKRQIKQLEDKGTLTESESFEDELMFKIKKTVEGTNGVENTSDPEYYPGAMFEHSFTFDYNGERYVVGLTVQDVDDEEEY